MPLSKGKFLTKIAIFCKTNADILKIKKILVLKGIFSKTKYVCVLYVPNFKFLG